MTQSEQERVASINDFIFQVSEDGIKKILNNDYKHKFKDILWTSNINQELPVKVSIGHLSQYMA